MSLSPFAQEGLLRVVRLLESMQDDRFNLSTWHSRNSCGTTYCAMGYAASTEWFRQRGLTLDGCGGIRFDRSRPAADGFTAVAKFFGISNDQAEYLFLPAPEYRTRLEVIERIRKFVARDGVKSDRPLKNAEKTRLAQMQADLDTKLLAEKAGAPTALMRRIMAQGEPLVPTTA